MEGIVREAYFDALLIMKDAPASLLPMSVIEMHLFSYLGCIISLFQGKPVSDWGYSYAVTKNGFPFSVALEDARKTLDIHSLVKSSHNGLMSPNEQLLTSEFDLLSSLRLMKVRRAALQAATQCALTLPVGAIRYAINHTPGISGALKIAQPKQLLEELDVEMFYSEYKIINSVLEQDAADLLSPAVLWLSARVFREKESVNAN